MYRTQHRPRPSPPCPGLPKDGRSKGLLSWEIMKVIVSAIGFTWLMNVVLCISECEELMRTLRIQQLSRPVRLVCLMALSFAGIFAIKLPSNVYKRYYKRSSTACQSTCFAVTLDWPFECGNLAAIVTTPREPNMPEWGINRILLVIADIQPSFGQAARELGMYDPIFLTEAAKAPVQNREITVRDLQTAFDLPNPDCSMGSIFISTSAAQVVPLKTPFNSFMEVKIMSLSGIRKIELILQEKERLRLEQRRKQCHALVSACQKTIRGVTDTAIQQLTSKDLRRFSDELHQVSGQIDSAPDRAHKTIRATQKQLNKTLAQAEVNAQTWSSKQAQARAQLRAMEQNLGAEKQVANEAGHKVLAGLDSKIAQAKTLYQQGHYREAKKLCKTTGTVLKEASQATFDETVRRKVVGGLLSTLMSMGFATEAPQLHGDEPDKSRVRLTGRMPSGRTATFEVKLDGQMSFDLDGYQGKACAKDLDQINSILQKQLDLKMGPVQFTWKNPDKIAKGARNFPSGQYDKTR